MLFVSISSIGYLFAGFVTLITGLMLRNSYANSKSEETRLLSMVLLSMSGTVFLFALPTFWFSDNPDILGWFNVFANILQGVFLAYIFRLTLKLHYPKREWKNVFRIMLVWAFTVLPVVNIIFLPQPYFLDNTFEVWNYHPVLWFNTGFLLSTIIVFFGFSVFSKYLREGGNARVAIPLSFSFTCGGLGGAIVTYTTDPTLLLIGYIIMFIGGFVIFTTTFLK